VKIIPQPIATRYTAFKVMRSITEIAIILSRIAPMRSNLVQKFTATGETLPVFKVKGPRSMSQGQSSRSQRKVTLQYGNE